MRERLLKAGGSKEVRMMRSGWLYRQGLVACADRSGGRVSDALHEKAASPAIDCDARNAAIASRCSVRAVSAQGWSPRSVRSACSCVLVVALTLLAWLGGAAAAVAANPTPSYPSPASLYPAVCRLNPAEIQFSHNPNLIMYDGSQIRLANTDVGYYPPGLGGLSLAAVSAALPISFPVEGARIRFFYLQDNKQKYGGYADGLLGCLYFHMDGKAYVLSNKFEQEGNSTPIVVSMFTLDLSHGIGRALFIVIRYDIHSGGGDETAYDLHIYGLKNITKKSSATDWTNFGLYDFTTKVLGNNSWNVTENDTIQSVHAYVDKASIVRRLKKLGYLK